VDFEPKEEDPPMAPTPLLVRLILWLVVGGFFYVIITVLMAVFR
jgi:hypothetical protein